MTWDEFSEALLTLEPALTHDVGVQILEHAELVADTAQGYLGEYQPGWPPLAPETIARKATGDSPLLETGGMRDSIGVQKIANNPGASLSVSVLAKTDYAIYQELGTATIPPRPFLTLSLAENEMELERRVDEQVGATIDEVFGI